MKSQISAIDYKGMLINRNMRCIEIKQIQPEQERGAKINRNMRCIEMNILDYIPTGHKINRNMRCIEIDCPMIDEF